MAAVPKPTRVQGTDRQIFFLGFEQEK